MLPAKRSGSPFPLYYQVMMEIRENILSGKWGSGSQIPGELDLARQLGVSVITVRQALGQLAEEGYLRRQRARGTFVQWTGPLRQSINLEVEAEDLVAINPDGTSFKLLDHGLVEPPKEISRDLQLEANEKVTRIIRIRLSQGQPLAYVISYVLSRIGSKIRAKDLTRFPLNTIVENLLPSKIAEVKHTVGARLADDEVADYLGIPAGSPVLYVERDYLHKKEMILRSVGFYRTDLFTYELTLKRRTR
ncbi:MAG TPA: GntR family transcriptional regulator [Candidatus Binatia bacterium]|nr:GntR family transcriptional regulator [Candidatus Binatia bacterium]